MNLLLSAEQEALAEVTERFLARNLTGTGTSAVRSAVPGVWHRCCDLGWFGAPEEPDSMSLSDQVVVFRELGRHLAPGPFAATATAAKLAGSAGLSELAVEFTSGATQAGFVTGGLVLDGTAGGYAVEVTEAAVHLVRLGGIEPRESTDPLSTLAAVVECPKVVIARPEPMLRWAALLLTAAQLVGIAEATRDMSVEYVKLREQFGAPIGSRQAIKHRCADMAVRCEAAMSLLSVAALIADTDHPDVHFHVYASAAVAADAARRNCEDNVQNHGALGFTYDHDAHRYVKRSLMLSRLLGGGQALVDALLTAPRRIPGENVR